MFKQGFPEAVQHFRERILAANALLIATPEYNHSYSGVLKNAIDWASRPDPDKTLPLSWKPIGIMSAANGAMGGVRAQLHLRQVFIMTNSYTLNRPQVIVTLAAQKFDENLRLTDEPTRKNVHDLLVALADFAPRFENLAAKPVKA